MIEITGHVAPVQPGGVKHFRKVFGGGGGGGLIKLNMPEIIEKCIC